MTNIKWCPERPLKCTCKNGNCLNKGNAKKEKGIQNILKEKYEH
jgi:hypothetical protein